MLKHLVVLSGKGGTGKTTVAGALIHLSKNKAIADCDVDAPNLHLIYSSGELLVKEPYLGNKKAVKDHELCIHCGKCEELCRFNAIEDGSINLMACEGCGVCEVFCPVQDEEGRSAIHLEDFISGEVFVSARNKEIFSGAKLKMGHGASGKLVTEVRKNLMNYIGKEELVIIDGSPGIGCPVIASLTGVNMALIVTEPTLSGMHDMQRVIKTARSFRVPCVVCINKFDINIENTRSIEDYCLNEAISIIGRIPYDPLVVKAVNSGQSIMEIADSSAGKAMVEIWDNLKKQLEV